MRRHSLTWLGALALALAVFPLAASAGVLTFDELAGPYGPIPNGYGGFNWVNMWYLDPSPAAYAGSGYQNGLVSGANVAYNPYTLDPMVVSSTAFTFNGAYLTGAWNDGLQVEVQGFVGTTMVYDTTVTASPTTGPPQFFTFDYIGVTELKFHSFGGTHHAA